MYHHIKYFYIIILLFCSLTAFTQVETDEQGKTFWSHPIKKGEQLHDIAEKYGLSIQQIKECNQLNNNRIDSLQSLKVPIAVQKNPQMQYEGKYVLYKVKDQERLHTIADQSNTSIQLLKDINRKRDNFLAPGDFILVPNTFPTALQINKFTYNGFLSLGFFTGNTWSEKTVTQYHIRGRITAQNVWYKKPFRNRSRFNSSVGYRHEIGKQFYKNVDRFQLRNQIDYMFNRKWAVYLLTSLNSQYADAYFFDSAGDKNLTSAFMAPGISSLSVGFTYIDNIFTIDCGLFERRTIHILQDKVYGEREIYSGVPRGDKSFYIQGMSLRMDVDYYKSENLNAQITLYSFANLDVQTVDLRSELNFRLSKLIKLTIVSELLYDKIIEAELKYRTEVLLGISFYKK